MRRARNLRVSSTRNSCIFCATRQFAAANAGSPFNTSQRRRLNSSTKNPQYADEGIVYKEAPQPQRPMSRAQLAMRQRLLEAKGPPQPPPPPPQNTRPPRSDHTRDLFAGKPLGQPRQQTQRQPLPRREPASRGGSERGLGRTEGEARGFPPRSNIPSYHSDSAKRNQYGSAVQPIRYQVNMDSGPPIRNTPAFDAGQLRRRTDPQQNRSPISATSPQIQAPVPRPPPIKLDQSELDALLGNNSQASKRPYTPLSRRANSRTQCMHCGQEGHSSLDCPSKPAVRQQVEPDPSQLDRYIADNVSAWDTKRKPITRVDAQTSSQEVERTRPEQSDKTERFDTPEDFGKKTRFQADAPRRDAPPRDAFQRDMRNRYRTGSYNTEDLPQRRGRFQGKGRSTFIDDEDEPYVFKAERKRRREEAKRRRREEKAAAGPIPVSLPEFISVNHLADLLKVRLAEFVRKLEDLGFEEVQHDHILNAEHAGLIAQEYGFEPIVQSAEDDGDLHPAPAQSDEAYAELPARPPVVTIMGHVDHGKTTILDYMRSSSVAASEFGGITQHIGAFSVPLASGKKITFLDTPGHAAFETMRARGANVTDIVVLVVAADDSVMPQTVEAIKHAQAANVPMIVAINKIDKSQADPDAVKLDLGRHGIEVEDFGGEVQAIPLSGKTGQGIPDLEEAITTLSEMLDHRADPNASVEGWVLEGTTKKSGRTATVLVRSGTLRIGDLLVAGTTWTRVRTLRNEAGVAVKEVGPGLPVEVDGWREQPIAGDEVLQATDEQHAQAVSDLRTEKVEREQMAKDMDAINEARRQENERREAEEAAAAAIKAGEDPVEAVKKETGPEIVSFIIKGDVSGSVEAVIDSVSSLGNGDIVTRILRHGVGSPSEFDVQHAADAQGHIINFNTPIPNNIQSMAAEKGVKILDNNIIYRVVENVKTMLEDRLPPRLVQKVTGEAEVAMVFAIGLGGRRKMKVAGSKVRNGAVDKGSKVKVLRHENVVYEGTISSLKNQKKDVDQMRKDTECGIAFESWEDFAAGDKIQTFVEESHKRAL